MYDALFQGENFKKAISVSFYNFIFIKRWRMTETFFVVHRVYCIIIHLCTVAESQHNFIVSLGEQLITIDALMCTISFVLKTLQDKAAQLVN